MVGERLKRQTGAGLYKVDLSKEFDFIMSEERPSEVFNHMIYLKIKKKNYWGDAD